MPDIAMTDRRLVRAGDALRSLTIAPDEAPDYARMFAEAGISLGS